MEKNRKFKKKNVPHKDKNYFLVAGLLVNKLIPKIMNSTWLTYCDKKDASKFGNQTFTMKK